jgi:hypothetical protein
VIARPSTPTRSTNAGEMSPDAAGRVDIKQYYSAGLALKNVEPVPQGGFRQMGGTRRIGVWRKPLAARSITSPATAAGPHTGTQTIWTGTVAGTVAAVYVDQLAITDGTATFTVEAEIASVWTAIAGPFAVAADVAESRMAAFAPGGQKTATGLRIRATFSESSSVTIGSVSAFHEDGTALAPRHVALTADDGTAYSCFVTAGIADFFTDAGHVGAARLAAVTGTMLPDLGFYAEASTIGIFHGELETVRLLLATPGQDHDWQADLWPYEGVPVADLGGTYTKTEDKWEIFLRWVSAVSYVYVSVTVNGETTPAVPVPRTGDGAPADFDPDTPDFALFATQLQTAIRALPSMTTGVTVSEQTTYPGTHKLIVTFGGDLAGQEFDLSTTITNTTDAAALPYHIQIGETELEDLFSSTRGWPGLPEMVQDRLVLGRVPASTGAVAHSATAEYFNYNIKARADSAARLDRIRSQTNETVTAIKESKYELVFTDKGVYFVNNRTIERNTPLNFVRASEIGCQPNCRPFDLEGVDYYVAINPKGISDYAGGGKQLVQLIYDDVSTSYNGETVSLLATHLVDRLVRSARQRPATDLDASKGWLMRADGRLIAGQFIKAQNIVGFCEWIAAASGAVREIGIDGYNRLWLAIERGAEKTYELYDTDLFLQDAVEATPDLAGGVTGLPWPNGTVVWAFADGYVDGPYSVQSGAVALGQAYTEATIGRWQAPRFESMPEVLVVGDDRVIRRPGRIHSADIHVMDTTSLAVGANGIAPANVPLATALDPVDQPTPARTGKITVGPLLGSKEDTTIVITQTRPGTLRVRDYAVSAKL